MIFAPRVAIDLSSGIFVRKLNDVKTDSHYSYIKNCLDLFRIFYDEYDYPIFNRYINILNNMEIVYYKQNLSL